MTACVNKHSKRVALAISASLVGALSLGATPALAQEAGIDILADSTATESGPLERRDHRLERRCR